MARRMSDGAWYDRVGETMDSVSRLLSPRPTETKLIRWRRPLMQRQQKQQQQQQQQPQPQPPQPVTATSTPTASAPTSRVNLVGARADSQDRLVQRIIGSQETLVGASPTVSATEVPSKVREFRFSSQPEYLV